MLVLLGWHDERVLGALVRHAKEAGWNMDTRHFFDETLPLGWTGDGTQLEYQAGDERAEWQRRRKWLARQLVKLPRPVGLFVMDDQLAAETVDVCLDADSTRSKSP